MPYKNALELAHAHVTEMLQLLRTMGERGIRVDTVKLAEFNSRLDDELVGLQAKFAVDPELQYCCGWYPKEGYKRAPKTTIGLEEHAFPDGVRWARRKPFRPTSTLQVKAYQRSKGHRIVTGKDGSETASQKQLLMAWRKHKDDHYRDFVDYRKLVKLRGTYGKWPVRSDSRVGTKFTLRPDTGRLSSIAPNVQNIPKDGPLAEAFRECLVASPGCKLVRADLVSVEALLTGWFAGDPDYMRLAKLGIHKFALAKYLEFPVSVNMTDGELQPWLERAKQEGGPRLYRQIKTVIYGGNYLAGPRTVYENNPEDFESQAEARQFLDFCRSLSPKIKKWQQTTTAPTAGRVKCLTNPFGYRKDFWDLPNDGPAAVAFLPQSTVAYIMKECMLQLSRMQSWKYMIWQIHDELVFDVPEALVSIVEREVREVMTQPWPQLGGLSIPVSIMISDSMA